MANFLVVDDEYSILESLEMFLSEKGHEVYCAATAREGLDLFRQCAPEIVILDIRLPDISGLELLRRLQATENHSKVIMITAYQDMETTISAMKLGAFDYIHKPLDLEELEKATGRALHILAVDRETPLPEKRCNRTDPCVIIGKSPKMREVFKTIGILCQNSASVLLQGETGTGKELIARVLHRNGPSPEQPFTVFDCSAVVETLLECELFGHEKGAFTGADAAKPGKIELTGNGTLFLDEIEELPLRLQGKLLGFLQRREFTRVGGRELLRSHCRIIAACKCDLYERVRQGGFKEDLYYRLKVVIVRVPPLRERLSDIPLLADHFVDKVAGELGTRPVKFQKGVIDRLMAHSWTGNVRELENVIVEAVVRARGHVILTEDIDAILEMNEELPLAGLETFSLEHMEKQHIAETLRQLAWNRTKAAQLLGISLPTLRSKIRKYDIAPPLFA